MAALKNLEVCRFQCPRDFKRTSVERHFREKGFGVDWCAFRLLNVDNDVVAEVTVAPPAGQE